MCHKRRSTNLSIRCAEQSKFPHLKITRIRDSLYRRKPQPMRLRQPRHRCCFHVHRTRRISLKQPPLLCYACNIPDRRHNLLVLRIRKPLARPRIHHHTGTDYISRTQRRVTRSRYPRRDQSRHLPHTHRRLHRERHSLCAHTSTRNNHMVLCPYEDIWRDLLPRPPTHHCGDLSRQRGHNRYLLRHPHIILC